ncbi:hypothetical protein EG327_003763 [Venturia inaequalis]|uniref:DUF1748-domain-containing protein n=2 Tax=Venturia inaequalis TaxID=5025 RepID=A0A8H3VCX7_VENIN|nr:hypothetical protein EG327_003763 [Venturia inaequalis]
MPVRRQLEAKREGHGQLQGQPYHYAHLNTALLLHLYPRPAQDNNLRTPGNFAYIPPQTSQVIMVLGRLTHYAVDAVLLSAFLAGVKRSTGLTPSVKTEDMTKSADVKKWIDNYLWVGEVVMDQSVALMSSSGYFERKR